VHHYFLLAGAWLLFALSHSFLAGARLERLFGRSSRLAYNFIAVVMTAIPLAMLVRYPAMLLWDDPAWLQTTRTVVSVALLAAFMHTLKFYSVGGFLGLQVDTWPLTFSPWHCWVRHPWYFLLLIFIWTRAMTDMWLLSALCITLYLVVGSRLEERRLLRLHPGSYAQYAAIVPGLMPWRGRALDEATRLRLEASALNETGQTHQ
jgi:protein-S-isoprenylcysteine O-methyltransferase Ste14